MGLSAEQSFHERMAEDIELQQVGDTIFKVPLARPKKSNPPKTDTIQQPRRPITPNQGANSQGKKVVYMDLLPAYPGVLQVNFFRIPGQELLFVHAKMVPRAKAQQNWNEVNEELQEHRQSFEWMNNRAGDDEEVTNMMRLAVKNIPTDPTSSGTGGSVTGNNTAVSDTAILY